MKKEHFIVSVNWETDNQDIDLPSEVEIPSYIRDNNDDISEYLSQNYGWLVKSYVIIK
jgi:hypothetical protein